MPDEFDNPAVARILIAEDETITAEDLALTASDFGHEVVGLVQTGQLAIELADELKPDLILMDIKLADDIDGIQASEQIRSRLDIPIIFLTAYEKTDTISRAKMTEPYGFITKPFSSYVLKTAIEVALYKHAADKRVKESEQRYRTLVEQSIDGIALIQGITVRFVNPGCAKMFGFESTEGMEEQDFLTFVAPEFRDLMKKMGYEREQGKPVPTSYEFTALRKDGTPFAAEIRVNSTTYRGKPAIQAVIRDITERRRAEEELRVLTSAVEQSIEGIVIVDLQGNLLYLNDAFARMHGCSPQELLGRRLSVCHTSEQMPSVETASLQIRESGYFSGEIWHVKKDGTRFPTLMNSSLVSDGDGKPLAVVGAAWDITDRKQAEEALRESEELFRMVFEQGPLGMSILRPNLERVAINAKLTEMFGYTEEELQRLTFLDLTHPDDIEITRTHYDNLLKKEIPFYQIEKRYIKKGGEIIWVRVTLSAVRDSQGELLYLVSMIEDITERKEAEEALRKSEERYRELVEMSDDIAYRTDSGGFFNFVNQVASRLTGYSEAELIGLRYTDIILPEYREASEKFYGRQFVKKIPTTYYELPIRTKTGEAIWVGQNVQLLTKNEEVVGFQAIVRDITRTKMAEEALRKAKEDSEIRVLERTADLRKANEQLQLELTERERAEETIRQKTLELGERVKELYCLYGISELFENREISRDQSLQGIVDLIPPAWKYPEVTCARIILDQGEFTSGNYRELVSKQSAHIIVLGKIRGVIEVGYFEERPAIDEGPFTKEERLLLNAIAERVGRVVERTTAQEDLRTEKEFTEKALNTHLDTFFLFEIATGRALRWNQAFKDITGYSDEEIAGMPAPDSYYSPEDLERARMCIQEILQAGSGTIELELICKDGQKVPTEYNASVLNDLEGTPKYIISVGRDIRERKKAEEQREILRTQLMETQKMESIGTLTGGIAHDFNNLLTIMNGYTELILSEKTEDDPIYRDLQTILETGRKGAELVQRLLAFSKKSEITLRSCSLNLIAENSVALMKRTIPKMIEIETIFAKNLAMVNADAGQIEQVLLNLCINAKDAMPEGGKLRIETRNVTVDEAYCRIHPEAKARSWGAAISCQRRFQ